MGGEEGAGETSLQNSSINKSRVEKDQICCQHLEGRSHSEIGRVCALTLHLHTDLLNNLQTLSHFFHPDQIPKNITGTLIKQIKTVKSAQMPTNNPYFAIIIFKMKRYSFSIVSNKQT